MRTKKQLTGFSVLLLSVGLSACSSLPGMGRLFGDEGFFRDRQGDYLEAESIPRLKVPDDMDSYIIDDLLIIPNLASNDGQAFLQVPRPRPIQGDPGRAVVIQRMEDRSWIVVDASASQVWTRVRQYWLEKGVDLAVENPGSGLLDTSWYSPGGNSNIQEKIRITIQPGFQDDSSEISLIQISAPQGSQLSDQVDWPEKSVDQEYAFEVLADLSAYLANEMLLYQASTVSFLAGSIPSEGRARIIKGGEAEVLHLDADFTRSWAAVGRALERAEVEIVSEDMDARYFQVVYSGRVEEQPGFLGRIFSNRARQNGLPFRINLQESGSGIDVVVENASDSDSEVVTEEGSQTAARPLSAQETELKNSLLEAIQEFIS